MNTALKTATATDYKITLTEDDSLHVKELVARISDTDPTTVVEFGRDVAKHTSEYADKLLDQASQDDLSVLGERLTEVVVIAKTLNINGLGNQSTIPLIGALIDRFRMTKEKFVVQYQSTKQQIETLVGEVSGSQNRLQQRNKDLESMYQAVTEEYRLLELHIIAGKKKFDEINARIEDLSKSVVGGDDTQLINDMHNQASFLDKRIKDLLAIQQSALHTLPMIRVIQANNSMLVDKFHTINELTLPSWKRQFMVALALNEQRNAVQLANSIDDANNEFLRKNAELLKQNAISTAKANQRLVIDVDTLRDVQNSLISTIEEVIKIQKTGIEERKKFEGQIMDMRKTLSEKLARKEVAA